MKIVIFWLLFIFVSAPLFSQDEKYNVVGKVTEETTNNPIEGVVIHNVDKNQYLGMTDNKGEFKIQLSPGRELIQFVLIGYSPIAVEVDVRPITEYISVSLESTPLVFDDLTIVASKPEVVGVRKFRPEEAIRYAGSLGDPARMVRSFAGVQALNDSRNDIIVRGNSPIGLQWRLDGFEVPNPNHHGGMGLTGSVVSILNTNLLANSDFYLGGWGANLSNATSGIFDLQMKGQNDIKKRSYWFQVGWNGFELGLEGNFDKRKKTTYIADYRYSFLGLMNKLGMNMSNTPEYQDFTFKTTAELGEKHSLELLGIWGDSHISLDGEDEFTDLKEKIQTGSQTIVAGLTHNYKIKSNQSLTTKLSYMRSEVYTDVADEAVAVWQENSVEDKYSFSTEYMLRLKAGRAFTAGVNFDIYDVDFNEAADVGKDELQVVASHDGDLSLVRGFVQYQTYIASKLKTTIGINASYLTLGNAYSIEPRVSLKYSLNSTNSLSLAAGKYSQMQPRPIYFTKDEHGTETNKNLGFTKNLQAILSYNLTISPKWHLKAEAYYQYLYDVPVVNDPNSTLSLLNFGAGFHIPRPDSLINKGNGHNYGLEITVERYFQNNFYLLANASLYTSKYTNGFSNTQYSTSFDGNYSFNVSAGYEWNINKIHALLFDLRGSLAGGQRYTPLDEVASIAAGKEIFDYSKTNSLQLSPYMRADFKLTYRMNAPRLIYDFSIDFQNFTNHKNPYLVDYRFSANDVEEVIFYQSGFMPMFTFKMVW